MQHVFDPETSPGKCLVCGATVDEINDNIATVDCLGPAGYQLRKEAILGSGAPQATEDSSSKLMRSYTKLLDDALERWAGATMSWPPRKTSTYD